MAARKDKAPLVLALSAALALSSVSLLVPRTHAAPAKPAAPAAPEAQSLTLSQTPAIDDGDGDELLEHWGDARYAREEWLQMGGIMLLLAGVSTHALCRDHRLRRAYVPR